MTRTPISSYGTELRRQGRYGSITKDTSVFDLFRTEFVQGNEMRHMKLFPWTKEIAFTTSIHGALGRIRTRVFNSTTINRLEGGLGYEGIRDWKRGRDLNPFNLEAYAGF